eukprot:759746-Hanusia_phi.AAC.1
MAGPGRSPRGRGRARGLDSSPIVFSESASFSKSLSSLIQDPGPNHPIIGWHTAARQVSRSEPQCRSASSSRPESGDHRMGEMRPAYRVSLRQELSQVRIRLSLSELGPVMPCAVRSPMPRYGPTTSTVRSHRAKPEAK